MQKINYLLLSQLTGDAYFPFLLRLSTAQPHGFDRNWPTATIQPTRHLAYAIQWFLTAIGLLMVYFILMTRERKT